MIKQLFSPAGTILEDCSRSVGTVASLKERVDSDEP